MKRTMTVVSLFVATCACMGDAISEAIVDSKAALIEMRCDEETIVQWGIPSGFLQKQEYVVLTNAIASAPSQVMLNWAYYSTNSFDRIIILDAIPYAGTNAYKTVLDDMISMVTTNAALCDKSVFMAYCRSVTTPFEHYLAFNYNDPVISNALTRALQIPNIAPSERDFILKTLNGEEKTYWESPEGRYFRGLPPLESNE